MKTTTSSLTEIDSNSSSDSLGVTNPGSVDNCVASVCGGSDIDDDDEEDATKYVEDGDIEEPQEDVSVLSVSRDAWTLSLKEHVEASFESLEEGPFALRANGKAEFLHLGSTQSKELKSDGLHWHKEDVVGEEDEGGDVVVTAKKESGVNAGAEDDGIDDDRAHAASLRHVDMPRRRHSTQQSTSTVCGCRNGDVC